MWFVYINMKDSEFINRRILTSDNILKGILTDNFIIFFKYITIVIDGSHPLIDEWGISIELLEARTVTTFIEN